MSGVIRFELGLIARSFAMGAALMMLYDLLRLFRLLVRHNAVFLGIEDFLYWIFCGFASFAMLYQQNGGILRFYVIVGIFAGMIIYDRLVSTKCFTLLKNVVKTIRMKRDKKQKSR